MFNIFKKYFYVVPGVAVTLSACNEIEKPAEQAPIVNPTERQSRPTPSVAKTTTTQRQNYTPILLADIIDAKSRVGNDPKVLALSAFGNTESEGGVQQVSVDYPQPDQAIVIITQVGVADDSVRGIRYRIEFVPAVKSSPTSKWEMVWAGSQVTCQSGRGHQDWSKELCL